MGASESTEGEFVLSIFLLQVVLQSIVSTVSTTNPQLNDELLSFELDLDLSLTDLSSSTLCDPSDTAIHSGPVSFIQ